MKELTKLSTRKPRVTSPSVARVRAIELSMRARFALVALEAAPVALPSVRPDLSDAELERLAPPVEEEPFDSGSTPAGYSDCERQNTTYEWGISNADRFDYYERRERRELNFALSSAKAARHRGEMTHWAARLDAAPADCPSLPLWSAFYEAAEKPYNELHRACPELARFTGGPVDRFLAVLGVCA